MQECGFLSERTAAKTRIFISMKQFLTYQLIFIFILAIGKPVAGFTRVAPLTDTIPAQTNPGKVQEEVKAPDIIKEVPKSRRQIKPVPVPTPIPVKPIKVIKPKVIRPKVGLTL
jgi:hypothetical protein